MSYWTYVTGTITVSPMGRTQHEKEYILKTVLDHLPIVSGSEKDMKVHIIQKYGDSSSCSCDEFGMRTDKSKNGWFEKQDEYILVLEGALRDRQFCDTFKEFMKWIIRLSKRIMVYEVLVKIVDYSKRLIIDDKYNKYRKMFERPSWSLDNGEKNWCEYLMWDNEDNTNYPEKLYSKYFCDVMD